MYRKRVVVGKDTIGRVGFIVGRKRRDEDKPVEKI